MEMEMIDLVTALVFVGLLWVIAGLLASWQPNPEEPEEDAHEEHLGAVAPGLLPHRRKK